MIQQIQGTLQIRQHCTFKWRQPESGYRRVVDIEAIHCDACIAELLRMVGFVFNDLRPPTRSGTG